MDREVYIGHDAQHMRGVLTLKYPIRNGVVRNWDEMEMVSRCSVLHLCGRSACLFANEGEKFNAQQDFGLICSLQI